MVVDTSCHCVSVGGQSLIVDGSGAIFWPAERALLVADLHLEKGSHFAERGSFLPPYDTRETLARLAGAVARYAPAVVIALGDSFHGPRGTARIQQDDLETLWTLQAGRDWVWITGNHDPRIAPRMGGRVCAQIELAGLTLRHEPSQGEARLEIAGHLHPVARVAVNGHAVRRPCFIGDGSRMVMPAFGAYTGGLNVLDAAFQPLFGAAELSIWMLGEMGLYPVPTRHLTPD
jgi:uncharacterized protein